MGKKKKNKSTLPGHMLAENCSSSLNPQYMTIDGSKKAKPTS